MKDTRLIEGLLSQPTSPYREEQVIRWIKNLLDTKNIPHFQDSIGNIVIGPKNFTDYKKLLSKKSKNPLRILIAHMDHPGFHGAKWLTPTSLQCTWHGGSPVENLEGAKVWTAVDGEAGYAEEGRVSSYELKPHGKALHTLVVEFEGDNFSKRSPKASQIFGGFAFRAPIWIEGDRVYTKAADDLIGVYTILEVALALFKKKSSGEPPFIGLLTRAEEVGFVGLLGHLELGLLQKAKRPLLTVSLEASRTLPGAELGKGPVVRLGDASSIFTPQVVSLVHQAAKAAINGKFQRRIMDGGSCEATALIQYKIPTAGLSVPLGNYHNQNLEGGSDAPESKGAAPEFVHLSDIAGNIELCKAFVKSKVDWLDPWKNSRKDLVGHYKKSKPLLALGKNLSLPGPPLRPLSR